MERYLKDLTLDRPDYLCQYVECVPLATNQYGTEADISYTALNLIGPPMHYPEHADHSDSYLLPSYGVWPMEAPSYAPEFGTAHLSARENLPIHDFVTVTFEQPVYPSKILIYETYNPSAVYRVWARVNEDEWKLMWDLRDHYSEPITFPEQARILEIHPPALKERTNMLRIEFMASSSKSDLAANRVHILDLPDELLLQIFSNLDLPTRQVTVQVCEKFARIASDSRLYREVNFQKCWMQTDVKLFNFVMKRCNNIRKLDLSWCGSCGSLKDCDVKRFLYQRGRSLTHLYMNEVTVTLDVLNKLDRYCPLLKELCMRNTSETLEVILVNNKALQHLKINCCPILDMKIIAATLGKCNHELVTLNAYKTYDWNTAGLISLQNCTKLQELDIGWTFQHDSTDDLLTLAVAHWPQLKRLCLAGVRSVSSEDVLQIAQHCPALEQLDLMGCIRVEESKVDAVLERCPRLRLLDLTYCSSIRLDWVEAARERYPTVCMIKMES
uniref:F-box domain-containing protein n=1 Tax=Anopheles farauti TaxID=69004 RepID=A0A182QHC9_9DIPT